MRTVRTPRYMHTFVYEHPIIAFEDVALGPDALLGEIGQGHELTRDWFVEERLMIAARVVGAAERALREAVEFASRAAPVRRAACSTSSSSRRWSPTASSTSRPTARSSTRSPGRPTRASTARRCTPRRRSIKLAASEAGGRVVDRALQILGGRGYMRENAVERLYRDLRVDRIWEGTSEIQRLIVGNEVAKRGLDGVLGLRARPPQPSR